MRHILVVGEKTSQVKKFAASLCGSYQSINQAKYVYTYTGVWNAASVPTTLTFLPLIGHISTIDTAKGYGWGECPPIKIVSDPKALQIKHTRKYVTILRKQIINKDELWLALDPDSEGDNIALEVVDILSKQIRQGKIPLQRIWNSSLTDKEIKRAFLNPKPWSNLLALGVQGRRLIDAWLGFAGTREITRAARKVAKIKVLSVGRVQLPTLYLVVKADLSHELFKIENRWKLQATFSTPLGKYEGIHQLGLVKNRQSLDVIKQKLTIGQPANIIHLQRQQKHNNPPYPHNTTAAVAMLSKIMKIKSQKALDLMVDLYNRGLLSYPRTENKKFADQFPHKDILSKLLRKKEYVGYIGSIKDYSQVVNNGPKKGVEEDHDPIHPTGELDELQYVDDQHKKVWDILTRYYISLFLEDEIIDQVSIITETSKENFLTEGRTVVQEGWKAIQWWTFTKIKPLAPLQNSTTVLLHKFHIDQSKTKPPKRISDGQLLLEMEKVNIGTKSSRPDIIKKIEQRNYVKRQGQNLISTPWGRTLIASLAPIWPRVITPEFTSHVETLTNLVATGQKNYPDMINQLRKEYLSLHKELFPKLDKYQQLLLSLDLQDQSRKEKNHDTAKINKLLLEVIPT